jgi:hypothetical protein
VELHGVDLNARIYRFLWFQLALGESEAQLHKTSAAVSLRHPCSETGACSNTIAFLEEHLDAPEDRFVWRFAIGVWFPP